MDGYVLTENTENKQKPKLNSLVKTVTDNFETHNGDA